MSYGILLLRVVLGGTMAAHGSQKLFGVWNGPGLRGVHGWLASMRFRGGWAPVAGLVLAEFGGGVALALGLLTPIAAFAIIVAMLVAIATVHGKNGFWSSGGGYEFNLLIVAAATALAVTGGARFSVDNALGIAGRLSGLWWGVGALGVGAVVALAMVTLGRRPETVAEPHENTLRTA
ncbi:MAG TPA: DoxX family protein [Gaiellaceae bacterium]|jgi:putative oxidoreductase